MENIIAVFNNRNQAMRFSSNLKKLGIPSKVINTPRDLSVSCGISVVFNSRYLGQCKLIMGRYGFRDIKLYLTSGDIFRKYHQIY